MSLTYYRYTCRVGEFRLVPDRNGRWNAMFDDEGLGSYATVHQALEDLVGGHTYWPSCGDPSELGLPDDLSGWEAIAVRR
ncbi:MAG TPA: hypothetical protein VJ001_05490 [Rhodocyclaceae bacterium]|nr:hypothetical protein [Rhodocyclaceae bacterium]